MYNKGKPAPNAKYNNPEFIGKKFGRLTVLEINHAMQGKYNKWMWKCRCDCGNIGEYRSEYVCSGHTTSCGCALLDNKSNLQHGECKSRLHTIWCVMRERCRPGHMASHWHGDRGISVCQEWNDYKTFAKWAKESGYNDTMSIERIDNDGNYCPENCKWIQRPLQARNRRTTMYVDYNGERMSLAEACELANVPYKQTWERIKRLGWPAEKALSIPINETRKWKRSERFCKQAFNLPSDTAKCD